MSSKLVKKLLQQTATPRTRNESSSQTQLAANVAQHRVSKEDLLQEHVQSVLRFDNLVQRYSSTAAKKSFDRRSASLKQQQKQKQSLTKNRGSMGNSRSSSSSFAKQPLKKTFDKKEAKRRREEGYFEDLAKALKKAKKRRKKM